MDCAPEKRFADDDSRWNAVVNRDPSADAERAGFRQCSRCRPGEVTDQQQAVARARLLLDELRGEFPGAEMARDEGAVQPYIDGAAEYLSGRRASLDLPLDVQATDFQRRVWDALRLIPRGETRTYSQVAAMIGEPRASRAVARACAANPVALVIPCHRVIGSGGGLRGYRWGLERKRALLARERSLGGNAREGVQLDEGGGSCG